MSILISEKVDIIAKKKKKKHQKQIWTFYKDENANQTRRHSNPKYVSTEQQICKMQSKELDRNEKSRQIHNYR